MDGMLQLPKRCDPCWLKANVAEELEDALLEVEWRKELLADLK
jgi:hypothetical protein